ncbi:MAG TPA: hypothetical protein VG345_10280 [Bryobacteraceae bacterium]|nr:hypothetical protein [Bryobacteraceae bacterium]
MIEDLVHQARRRLILNETLGQITLAAAVACGGFALILLVGSRYLEWWSIGAFAALALAFGLAKIWRRIPQPYSVAQRLDRAAGLPDLLSTAIHFGDHPARNAHFRNAQRAQAESAARQFDLGSALPWRFPRAFYPLAALTLLASGLVVLRYSLTRSLDLRAPLTEVLFEDQLAHQQPRKPQLPAAARSFKALKAAETLMARLNMPPSPDQRQDPDALDKAIDQALAPAPGAKSGQNEKNSGGKNGDQKNTSGVEPGKNGDPLNGGENANSPGAQDAKSPEAKQNDASPDKEKSGNASEGNNSSLLSKLKDAVSNMFSRSRQDNSQGQKNASQPSGQMAKSDRQNSGKNSGGKGQQQSDAQADAQQGDPNGDPQEGQQAQGQNGAKTSAQNSAQAGSGIGSQDGAKDLRAAAQLKAMGRISEIIGKRAATITGETMVEVQSGNQQLRTAYSDRAATHADSDSDLNRDEIPPALQTYVANYFEQVRKPAAKSRNPRPTPAPSN